MEEIKQIGQQIGDRLKNLPVKDIVIAAGGLVVTGYVADKIMRKFGVYDKLYGLAPSGIPIGHLIGATGKGVLAATGLALAGAPGMAAEFAMILGPGSAILPVMTGALSKFEGEYMGPSFRAPVSAPFSAPIGAPHSFGIDEEIRLLDNKLNFQGFEGEKMYQPLVFSGQ